MRTPLAALALVVPLLLPAASPAQAVDGGPQATAATASAGTDDGGRIAGLLADGHAVLGIFSGEHTREQGAAMAANRELDFVFYSLERGPFDLPTMQDYMAGLAEAAGDGGAHPLALRIPPIRDDFEVAAERVRQALAAGVESIVFPHVENRRQAAAAVAAMGRTSWPRNEDGRVVSMLIIEDRVGVDNASEIVGTPGVSVVFAGPGDLSRAYERDAEAVEGAIQTVLAACQEHDVPCGITAGPDDIARRLRQGFRMIIVTQPEALAAGREYLRATATRQAAFETELAMARPIDALDSVWLEELTWIEIRDALAAGKTTAIVSTGGIEQNGPYVAMGKHNYILRGACERIARMLGDALCAPIIKLVPEGGHHPPTGHMRYPGTLSMREETFRAMLEDVGASLAAHGFEHVVFIGDSGGNQRGMAAVAETLEARWESTRAHYIAEFYQLDALTRFMNDELGITEPVNDGYHDYYWVTAMQAAVDPSSVRYQERLAAGKTTINGVDIHPIERTIEVGNQLLDFRARQTVAAIRAARGDTPETE